jgi:predicted  nucleic acid-binding Zn-ribbon protein
MRHALLLALTVFFSTCLSISPVQAQYASAADSEMIDIDFPGGTLGEYIEAIEEACEATINFVVVDDKVLAAPIAKLRLRGITPNTALELVRGTKVVIGSREYLVDLDPMGGAQGEAATIRVSALDRGNAPRETVSQTMIFAGQPLIDAGLDAEYLLAALEIALDLSASGEPAVIRFHEETGLIFANGSNDQISAIHQLMSTLRNSLETNIASPVQDLERELQESHAVIEAMEMELDEAHTMIADLQAERAAFAAQMQAMEMQMGQYEEQANQRLQQVEETAILRMQDLEERAQHRLQMERERAEQQVELTRQQMLAEAEGKIKQMSLEYQDLERRFEEVSGKYESVRRGNASLGGDLARLSGRHERLEQEQQEWKEEREQLTARIAELERALAAEREKNDDR